MTAVTDFGGRVCCIDMQNIIGCLNISQKSKCKTTGIISILTEETLQHLAQSVN